jgi:hypothetical protein
VANQNLSWEGILLSASLGAASAGIMYYLQGAEPSHTPAAKKVAAARQVAQATEKARPLTLDPTSNDPLDTVFGRNIELPELSDPQAVRAWGEGSRTVVQYEYGPQEVRGGGTVSWRNNNPGNLRGAPDQVGRAHGFAVFSDEAAGEAAMRDLLSNELYASKSIDQAISDYAPAFENNTPAYQEAVRRGIGAQGSTPIDQLTNSQFDALVRTIRQVEVWKGGTVMWRW